MEVVWNSKIKEHSCEWYIYPKKGLMYIKELQCSGLFLSNGWLDRWPKYHNDPALEDDCNKNFRFISSVYHLEDTFIVDEIGHFVPSIKVYRCALWWLRGD